MKVSYRTLKWIKSIISGKIAVKCQGKLQKANNRPKILGTRCATWRRMVKFHGKVRKNRWFVKEKKAEHFKENGKVWKKHLKQWKEDSQKMKDIARPKTTNIFRTGLAVDLRRMPSTCPCRASIQGYRGSSQSWGGLAVETLSCWLGDTLKALSLGNMSTQTYSCAHSTNGFVCFNPRWMSLLRCVFRLSYFVCCMLYVVKVLRMPSYPLLRLLCAPSPENSKPRIGNPETFWGFWISPNCSGFKRACDLICSCRLLHQCHRFVTQQPLWHG